jgi:hypothetical protein
LIPVYHIYQTGYQVCDKFNRSLHDCKWPHRHGGGTSTGDLQVIADFYFSSILRNTIHIWEELGNNIQDFQTFCIELSDELYLKSNNI